MERALDPVYLRARAAIESVLDSAGYHLASESHHPDSFGSAEAEYRGRHQRIRLTWDGKDRWLGLVVARSSASNQHPRPDDWHSLDPKATSAPQQFLHEGPSADARIAELARALSHHIEAAV
jgi:hypothetical protein